MTNFNYIGEFYGDDGARENDGICYGCGLVGQGEIGFWPDLRDYSSQTQYSQGVSPPRGGIGGEE